MRNSTKLFFLMIFISMQLNASMTTSQFIGECIDGENKIVEMGNLTGNDEASLASVVKFGAAGLAKGHCTGIMQASVEAARLATEIFHSNASLFNTCREITYAGLISQTKKYVAEHVNVAYKSPTRLLLNVIRDNYNVENPSNACDQRN